MHQDSSGGIVARDMKSRGSNGTRRLWMVEKPFWTSRRWAKRLWQLTVRIWRGLFNFLNRDVSSVIILCAYALGVALFLFFWQSSRDWLGMTRPIDVILLTISITWLLMLVVWSHESVREKALRWVPALLSFPLWFTPLLALLVALALSTVALLAVSLVITPFGFLAMIAGVAYSWWRKRHGIILRCTRGECLKGQFRDVELRYNCPGGCGATYAYLMPSHLGFRYHDCTCGARLPALMSLRRQKMDNGKTLESTLKKECPRGHVWGIGTEGLPSYFVALVGGGRVGKTTYMTMVVQNLLDGQVSSGLKATFESSEDEEQQKKFFKINLYPEKF